MGIRKLTLYDEKIDTERVPVTHEGAHLLKELHGVKVFANSKGGRITGYHAEKNGKTVETFILREEDHRNGGAARRGNCQLCICDETGCRCYEIGPPCV